MTAFSLFFPFCKRPLALVAFVKRENVREDAACNGGNGVLRDAGIVDELLRLPKIVLLRTPLVDSEGVLGVFEMEKRRYRIKERR